MDMGLQITSLILLLLLTYTKSQLTQDYCPGNEACDLSIMTESHAHSSELTVVSQKVSQLFSAIEALQQKQTDLEGEVNDLKDENQVLKEQIELLNKTNQAEEFLSKHENCGDLYHAGNTESGVYTVYISSQYSTTLRKVSVYCDMDTSPGGWTVFQRRVDGSVSFDKAWYDYTNGFGNISGEFWLGNELLSEMTKLTRLYRLRVDLTSFDNQKRYAEYENFCVTGATDNFRLKIGTYSGNAGDNDQGLSYHNNMQFSTKDNDNDESSNNCAGLRGGGFWFKKCDMVNTNAKYKHSAISGSDTIQWEAWLGTRALKGTEMKFRPM